MNAFIKRLFGKHVELPPPPAPQHYVRPKRNMYDRLAEKRLAQEAAQRLLDRAKPRGDFCAQSVSVEDLWLRLPGHSLDQRLPVQDIPKRANALSHDSRLMAADGSRRLLRRIEIEAIPLPSINPLARALELLQATLTQCPLLDRVADWTQIEVHLFPPSHVDPLIWFETVVSVWPQVWLPGGGFRIAVDAPGPWLAELLSSNLSMPKHLCLSIDSWATLPANAHAADPAPLGEVVSLVSLKRDARTDTPTTVPEQTFNQQVQAPSLCGQVGTVAAEWTRTALGCLAARASSVHPRWVLDLTDSDSSSGLIIAESSAVPTAPTGSPT
ncbi:hypothetical protein [Pseudomonas syringae]